MAAKSAFAGLISQTSLRKLAGEKYFERGLAYFREGAVERLVSHGDRIIARVAGTDVYTIKLWRDGRRLDWSCTCPLGQDGEFCKHVVATGLAWLDQKAGPEQRTSPEIAAIRKFLEASDKRALADILTERACEDEELAERLLLAAQRQGASDPGTLKETIRRALASNSFVDYREMPRVAARAAVVPEFLRELLKQGNAREAVELVTDAMKRGLKLLERSDDSDGRLGGVLSEIAAVRLEALRMNALTPVELAKNLFDLQLSDSIGFFSLEDHLPALGKEGLAAYRRLAETAWKKVSPRGPGTRGEEDNGQRYQLTEIMKTLARMDDDTDALVDALKHDLTQPHTYVEIAQALSQANRHDDALHWAEAGRRAFKGRLNVPLDDFLVAEYHRRKRHDDAVALRWSRFLESPSLPTYQQLKAAASRAKSWPAWREKAVAFLRKPESRGSQPGYSASWIASNASVLVQALLWEGDAPAALEAARAGGCGTHLWLQLAGALETDHADEAIVIYRRQIDPIVRVTGNPAYDQAADLLRRVRVLMARTGKSEEFGPYLDGLRTRYKAKRNFMQRLETVATEKAQDGGDRERQASKGKPSSAAD